MARTTLLPRSSVAEAALRRHQHPLAEFARRYRQYGGAVAALGVLIVAVLLTVAAPLLAPADPVKMGVGPIFTAPNPANWLGTDNFGRDILSRVLWGGQISLRLGLISVSIAT